MLQIKLFNNSSLFDTQSMVNKFLKSKDETDIKDIKFIEETKNFYPTIMIIYEGEE